MQFIYKLLVNHTQTGGRGGSYFYNICLRLRIQFIDCIFLGEYQWQCYKAYYFFIFFCCSISLVLGTIMLLWCWVFKTDGAMKLITGHLLSVNNVCSLLISTYGLLGFYFILPNHQNFLFYLWGFSFFFLNYYPGIFSLIFSLVMISELTFGCIHSWTGSLFLYASLPFESGASCYWVSGWAVRDREAKLRTGLFFFFSICNLHFYGKLLNDHGKQFPYILHPSLCDSIDEYVRNSDLIQTSYFALYNFHFNFQRRCLSSPPHTLRIYEMFYVFKRVLFQLKWAFIFMIY